MIDCLPTQALAFLAVFVYATHATQAIAFEWKPGLTDLKCTIPLDMFAENTVCYTYTDGPLATALFCIDDFVYIIIIIIIIIEVYWT